MARLSGAFASRHDRAEFPGCALAMVVTACQAGLLQDPAKFCGVIKIVGGYCIHDSVDGVDLRKPGAPLMAIALSGVADQIRTLFDCFRRSKGAGSYLQ